MIEFFTLMKWSCSFGFAFSWTSKISVFMLFFWLKSSDLVDLCVWLESSKTYFLFFSRQTREELFSIIQIWMLSFLHEQTSCVSSCHPSVITQFSFECFLFFMNWCHVFLNLTTFLWQTFFCKVHLNAFFSSWTDVMYFFM